MFNLFYLIGDIIEYFTLSKRERQIKRKVPYTCFYCEVLGICRDESNNWKCRRGCLLLNNYNTESNIPYRCEKCKYLYQCRDKYNGWKCYNGCIILNEERQQQIDSLLK